MTPHEAITWRTQLFLHDSEGGCIVGVTAREARLSDSPFARRKLGGRARDGTLWNAVEALENQELHA
jgi:hypothetical protein